MDSDSKNSIPAAGLFIVATPIGNLADISERAVESLKSVDLILAEDTRHFSIIADRFSISTRRKSFFEHNEREQIPALLDFMQSGNSIALVSDAGTPTIADPGYRLVRACHEAGIYVSTVPGPCAATAALSISGLPSDQFFFKGYAPQKPGKRKKFLQEALCETATTIIYETPHRILKCLADLLELAPEREIFLVRELSKKFEESFWGKASEIYGELRTRQGIKGEFVLIISKARKN